MKHIDRHELFSIPNLMGYFRILMIPVFCFLYLTAETKQDIWIAAAVVLISSLTDMLDGLVADKLTHGALAFCLAVRYPLMWALFGLLLIKEGYMAVMGLILLKKGKRLNGAMWFGKVCTALLFVGMLVLFLAVDLPRAAANTLILLMMAVMAVTLVLYIPVFEKMRRG